MAYLVQGGAPPDDSVTTVKIKDASVTAAKLGTGAVIAAKLGTGAVETAKLAANAVTAAKVSSDVPQMGRNLIINGEMKISQRGTSFAALANNVYSLDRWLYYTIGAAVITATQATDTPSGNFKNSWKADVTTADASVAAGDMSMLVHKIEGLNMSSLGWGTAQAKSVTLSFWVKSPKTGTHTISMQNSAQDRSYAATYTINSANTWEQQSITVAGDTSGTWLTTNGLGMSLGIPLMLGSDFLRTPGSWGAGNKWGGTGQVNCVDNTANNFYLTGVQLEVGSVATDFEHRDYASELAKCQRYFCKTFDTETAPAENLGSSGALAANAAGTAAWQLTVDWRFPTVMRNAPTVATYNPSSGTSGRWASNIAAVAQQVKQTGCNIRNDATTGDGSHNTIHATADAEL